MSKSVCASCISLVLKNCKSDDNMKPSWLNEFDYVDGLKIKVF